MPADLSVSLDHPQRERERVTPRLHWFTQWKPGSSRTLASFEYETDRYIDWKR